MSPTILSPLDTKERILDAAERLFAEHGFKATSLRQITSEARVNLAAVNYHFHSKDALIEAVLRRKIEPINRRRLELLTALETEAGANSLPLEGVIHALLSPVFEAKADGSQFAEMPRIMGRLYTEPGDWTPRIFGALFGPLFERFIPAFARALPGVSPADLGWGLQFSIGSMAHFLAAGDLLTMLSKGAADPSDRHAALDKLIRYTTAGIRELSGKEASQ
jgi:AcrR family transcriptional regulator